MAMLTANVFPEVFLTLCTMTLLPYTAGRVGINTAPKAINYFSNVIKRRVKFIRG